MTPPVPRGTPGCTCGTPPFAPPEPSEDCPLHTVECEECNGTGQALDREYVANRYNDLSDPRAPVGVCEGCGGEGRVPR